MTNTLLGDSIVVSPTEPVGNYRKKVWFKWSNNLFDKDNTLDGYEINGTTGGVQVNSTYFVSDYIKVNPNDKIFLSGKSKGNSNCFYDRNKKYLDKVNLDSGLITVPDNSSICYLRFNGLLTEKDNIMLEYGTSRTEYQPYVEPQIFIKNSNGVYEEFINKKELETEIFVNKKPFTANEGYTIDLQYMNKQGKHYWGTVVFHKNSGMFGSTEIALKCNVELAQIFSYGCFLGTNIYNALAVGYLHLRVNQELYVGDNNNTSKYNYARCFVDFIEK